ncbi:hypothetical protein BT93_I0428 [Corymbia citriodora subsp. variegata]|nr:hypothetical protein BT93_I0428 [Corymbia citriodora subsp. variegata]
MKKMDRSGSRQGKGQVPKVGSIMQSLPSQTQVFLNEWWLVNANGKGLAIGGFAHRDSERVSLFCSAPIVKRHDTTTFETADGMTIMVGGLINRLRTLENGFSSKVCNKFRLGFPYDWAEYSTSCYGDSSVQATSVKATATEETDSQSRSFTNYFEATSLDDVTVPRLHDSFCLSDLDDSFLMKKIYEDVVGMLGSGTEHDGKFLNSSGKSRPSTAAKSQINQAQINEKQSKEDGLCKHNEDILSARKIVKKVNHKSCHQLRAANAFRQREGVSTRSMTRFKGPTN